MPYVKQERRPALDKVVSFFMENSISIEEVEQILYMFGKTEIKPSYNNYKNFCGEIYQSAGEICRRNGLRFCYVDDGKHVEAPEIGDGRLEILEACIEKMKEAKIEVNGDLNYVLYALSMREFNKVYTRGYYVECLLYAERRIEIDVLAPYEDEKIKENGDV